MTPRRRILSAINHQEPDRVPIDCGAMHSTGIQAIAYNRLKAHLGIQTGHTRVFDVIQQLAEPEEPILDRFRVDAINAGRQFAATSWRDWTLPDGSPCQMPDYIGLRKDNGDWLALNSEQKVISRMIEGATYFSQTCHPLAHEDWFNCLDNLAKQMSSVSWGGLPEPLYAGGFSDKNLMSIAEHLKSLRARSDRAIMIAFGANLFEWGSFLRRMDNFLIDLALEPARVEALLDKLVEVHLAGLDKLLPVIGDNVDLIQLGDDLGTESSPFFSPEMYRRFFKPRHKLIVEHIKKSKPDLKIFLHSCGSIYALLHDLIEAGFEVVNPVQISAKNMTPAKLKSEFGNDITFWGGGCDTQKVLPRCKPQEIKDHVRRNIDILAPGGGFVFCQVHNILADVPPENVVAMYEEAMA